MISVVGSTISDQKRLIIELTNKYFYSNIIKKNNVLFGYDCAKSDLILYIADLKSCSFYEYAKNSKKNIIAIIVNYDSFSFRNFINNKSKNIINYVIVKNRVTEYCDKCKIGNIIVNENNAKCNNCHYILSENEFQYKIINPKKKYYNHICPQCYSSSIYYKIKFVIFKYWFCTKCYYTGFYIIKEDNYKSAYENIWNKIKKYITYSTFIVQLKKKDFIDIKFLIN